MKNSVLGLVVSLMSTVLHAQQPAVSTKAVVFDANDMQQSSVNVIAPASGVVTVGIDGNDMFITGEENSAGVELVLDRKTALVKLGNSRSDYVISVGLGTVCGISVAVNIKAIGSDNTVKEFTNMNPKVVVKAPKECTF